MDESENEMVAIDAFDNQ